MYTFFKQECIKLIKSDSKDIYNVKKTGVMADENSDLSLQD